MNRCRACPAPIRFVHMARTGKKNPLNTEVDEERGNVLIDEAGVGHAYGDAEAARGARALHPDWEGPFLSHFATCPERRRFKR